ncbi:MAG: NAD(P)/FAD-dependent oxidoreductase [Opitutaceae bacterium]
MPEVVVIGGGLSGLVCGLRLQESGIDVEVLEASDAVGGRVRTDRVDGFQLDRGFQVLLDSYPQAKHWLDFEALGLRRFLPGCLIFREGRFFRLEDPFRNLSRVGASLMSPVGSLGDKLRVARLRARVTWSSLDSVLARPEMTTRESLEGEGFTKSMIESFFGPFLRGIFLDPDLLTSSRIFHWVFRLFSTGQASLPVGGMQAIPEQLAAKIHPDKLRLKTRVIGIEKGLVRLEGGKHIQARFIVVATDPSTAARLLGQPDLTIYNSVTTFYYSVEGRPVREPVLVLNGEGKGMINHLCAPTEVAAEYGPTGRSLLCLNSLGVDDRSDRRLDEAVREQMVGWFGMAVADWKLLRIDRIPCALPSQRPPALSGARKPLRVADGLYQCGDHTRFASIDGAMESGSRVAEEIFAAIHA